MRYFAAANSAAASSQPTMTGTQAEVLNAISTSDLDDMSPRQAAEFLAVLHDRLRGDVDG